MGGGASGKSSGNFWPHCCGVHRCTTWQRPFPKEKERDRFSVLGEPKKACVGGGADTQYAWWQAVVHPFPSEKLPVTFELYGTMDGEDVGCGGRRGEGGSLRKIVEGRR